MKLVCVVLGWWYSLRAGGYWQGFRVSGHEFGEPVYDVSALRRSGALVASHC